MDRKVSRFLVGDEVTTLAHIRQWAGFPGGALTTFKIKSIIETKGGEGTRFAYTMTFGSTTDEADLIPASEAKKEAIKYLAERLQIISEWEEEADERK